MKISGAIFDFDGTLLDSMSVWATIGEDYLHSLSILPREKLSETFKKMSVYEAACYYIKKYGVQLTPDEIIKGVNEMIIGRYQNEISEKKGALSFLKKLKQNGIRCCVATATDAELVRIGLERNGMLPLIDRVFTVNEVGVGKEQPLIYETALSYLGTKKEETVVFEDALYAAKTAKKAGFPVVAIYDAFETEQEELKKTAEKYLLDFTEADGILS